MTDSEFTMFVFLWIFGAGIVIQTVRLFLLRKKFDRLALRSAQAAPKVPAPVDRIAQSRDEDELELERIKKRLQVLERIATDGSTRLDSEWEALRRA